jgi:micrococcal nuclease
LRVEVPIKFYSMLLSLCLTMPVMVSAQAQDYTVENIEDGDTITIINLDGESRRIQLSGIDAPEDTENAKLKLDIRKKGLSKEALLEIGEQATSFLKSEVAAGQKVTLQGDLSKHDKYGRIPAIVINEKSNSLNLLMVREGYAILLTRYPLEETFKANLEEAQHHARSNNRGLWKSHPQIMAKWSSL